MEEKVCKDCSRRIAKKCSAQEVFVPRKKPACKDFKPKK